jgi:RNA recognition motif-containing protein
LNFDTTEERLGREFQIFGSVTSVSIVRNKVTKKSKGYAFIEFRKERDADSKYSFLKI